MDNLEAALKIANLEGEVQNLQRMAHQLRQYLAGALCAECGEPLGSDEELMTDDEGRTLHQRCESAGEDEGRG